MTELEQVSYEVLREVLHYLTARKIGCADFMDLVHKIRMAVFRFENLKRGCPTGTHADHCLCRAAIVGETVTAFKRRCNQLE